MASSSSQRLPNSSETTTTTTNNNNNNTRSDDVNPWGNSWRLLRRIPRDMIPENPSNMLGLPPPLPNLKIFTTVPENPSGSTPWGIEVKPGHPYTYPPEEGRSMLRITKGSVGDGSTGFATHFYCKVGHNGHPFMIGGLPPHKTETVMNLYVKETEDVIFTVFGPQPVYLSGYYMAEHAELESSLIAIGNKANLSSVSSREYIVNPGSGHTRCDISNNRCSAVKACIKQPDEKVNLESKVIIFGPVWRSPCLGVDGGVVRMMTCASAYPSISQSPKNPSSTHVVQLHSQSCEVFGKRLF